MPSQKRTFSGTQKSGSQGARRPPVRRGRRKNARVTVPRNRLGFPQQMRSTLRYTYRSEFALTNTTAQTSTIRANDLFDPNYATGGHQPRGFDEFMSIYNEFTVLGSKVKVDFMYEGYLNPTTTGTAGNLIQAISGVSTSSYEVPGCPPVAVGIHKGVELLSSGTAIEQMEKDRTVSKIMTPNASETLRMSLKASDFFGKKTLVGSEGYIGNKIKGPDEEIYFEVWACRLDDNYNSGNIRVPIYVTVEYDAVFTKPLTLSAS